MQGRSLAALSLVSIMFAPSGAAASSPEIPGSGAVVELDHVIELTAAPEGATLHVTRTLFNAAPTPAQVELPIPLPCVATLDQAAIEEQDEHDQPRWRTTELLDVDDAAQRWESWLEGPGEDVRTALDADTALHLRRDDCDAQLSIWPIPPLHERKVSYSVFVPSVYVGGRHEIELPSFDEYGKVASLTLVGWNDPEFLVEVDDAPHGTTDLALRGDQSHAISVLRRDAGIGAARVADLDLARMIAQNPAATARLEPDEVPGRLIAATFDPPRELASLPPVRRVVVLLDASRSFEWQRPQLQRLAARYLELLAETSTVKAEVLLFDRELRRVYHDFVPADWAAEDLDDLELDAGNGSDLDAALTAARDLLASPSASEGADWILVISDLYLRSSFPLADELAAAAQSGIRMHVVRSPVDDDDTYFHPGRPDEAWTMIAREAGGMLWYTEGYDIDIAANELIQPTRIWSLRLEFVLADGTRRDMALADWHDAGESSEWHDSGHAGAALERAAFVGEVWGQRRAWTATPTDDEARRTAGRLATEENSALSQAIRTVLAVHAQVVSPFTSAWALASFEGPAAAPSLGFGSGTLSGRSISLGCGGAFGSAHAYGPMGTTVEDLTRHALAACPKAKPGTLRFETTDLEIVDVASDDRCIREQIWALDLTAADIDGRRFYQVQHETGGLLGTLSETPLAYRDLTMPTPNITTNMASGMK